MDGRVKHLKIPGALLIEAVGSADERGRFLEYLRAADLQAAGCGLEVAQVNCSVSVRGRCAASRSLPSRAGRAVCGVRRTTVPAWVPGGRRGRRAAARPAHR